MVYLRLLFEWWLSRTAAVLWLCRGIIWARADRSSSAPSSFPGRCFALPTLGFSWTSLLFSFHQPCITNTKFASPNRVEIGTCPSAEEYWRATESHFRGKRGGCSQKQRAGASPPTLAWCSSKVTIHPLCSELGRKNRQPGKHTDFYQRVGKKREVFCCSSVLPSGAYGGGNGHLRVVFVAGVLLMAHAAVRAGTIAHLL